MFAMDIVMNVRVSHALNFKKGSLVKHGRDDLRNNGAQMSVLIYPYVSCEPVLRESEDLHAPALVKDLKIVGLWETGKERFLDSGILNPDAPSYVFQDLKTVLNQHAKEKTQK